MDLFDQLRYVKDLCALVDYKNGDGSQLTTMPVFMAKNKKRPMLNSYQFSLPLEANKTSKFFFSNLFFFIDLSLTLQKINFSKFPYIIKNFLRHFEVVPLVSNLFNLVILVNKSNLWLTIL